MTTDRPLIGVTVQTLQAIDDIPAELPPSWVMNERYGLAVAAAGAVPVLIPLLDDGDTLRAVFDRVDGILVPGGVDIDPEAYGAAAEPVLGRIDPARDATEIRLTRWALDEGKPLLGLCRGLQILAVACGGTLWQDIAADRPDSVKHDFLPNQGWPREHLAHQVAVRPGSRLHRVLASETVAVNSMHHQGVRQLGDGLAATALAPDGLVEGVEYEGDSYAVGVQWHPEVFAPGAPSVGRLFEDFVAAARVRARS